MDATTIQELVVSGIDYEAGVDRFGGNEEMFERFIRRFLDDKHYANLQDALKKNDDESAFHEAHSLKGVVGNLSFVEYYDAITPVAELLRDRKMGEAIVKMSRVEEAHEKVSSALKSL